jgi:membrane-bound metal-dependent hydrolase YbcI (DUF457 family)
MGAIGHLAVPFAVWVWARAPLTCLLAALFFAYLPDADIFLGMAFTGTAFDYHRGATHTVFLCLLPAALYLLARKAEFAWGTFGAISHPLLDLLNTYPVMLFWPLSTARFMVSNEQLSELSEFSLGLLFFAALGYFIFSGRFKPYLDSALRAARQTFKKPGG